MKAHQEHLEYKASRLGCFEEPGIPCLFPDDLLSGIADRDRLMNGRAHWWLIYTKSRQEKMLAQQLFAQEIPFYLPLIKRRSLSRGRERSAFVPLFPGYLFLYGTDAHRLVAFQTNRVSTAVQVSEGLLLLKDLSKIAFLIANDAPLTPESRLVAGQHVIVKSGLFVGLEGVVFQRQGKTHLMVAVNFMQQGVSLAIEDYCLEPYEPNNTTTGGRISTYSVSWALDRNRRKKNIASHEGETSRRQS